METMKTTGSHLAASTNHAHSPDTPPPPFLAPTPSCGPTAIAIPSLGTSPLFRGDLLCLWNHMAKGKLNMIKSSSLVTSLITSQSYAYVYLCGSSITNSLHGSPPVFFWVSIYSYFSFQYSIIFAFYPDRLLKIGHWCNDNESHKIKIREITAVNTTLRRAKLASVQPPCCFLLSTLLHSLSRTTTKNLRNRISNIDFKIIDYDTFHVEIIHF